MNDIFITGTFRNEWNKEFNLRLANELELKGFKVFLPQRDSKQVGNKKETFRQDIAGIDSCKMILAIGTKTQTANWGFEIGYAYKSKMPVVILTDSDHPVELMPEGAATKIVVSQNIDDISSYIDQLIADLKTYL